PPVSVLAGVPAGWEARRHLVSAPWVERCVLARGSALLTKASGPGHRSRKVVAGVAAAGSSSPEDGPPPGRARRHRRHGGRDQPGLAGTGVGQLRGGPGAADHPALGRLLPAP